MGPPGPANQKQPAVDHRSSWVGSVTAQVTDSGVICQQTPGKTEEKTKRKTQCYAGSHLAFISQPIDRSKVKVICNKASFYFTLDGWEFNFRTAAPNATQTLLTQGLKKLTKFFQVSKPIILSVLLAFSLFQIGNV